MAREQLPAEVKAFIVQALACFDAPSVVVKAVKEQFELVVSPQQVETYDPTKRAGQALAQKWRELRDATRAAFLENTAAVGIAHRAVRLRKLDRMAGEAEKVRNYALAASLIEQAAKECGGAFTNKQRLEHTGTDGAPIATDNTVRIEFVGTRKDAADAVDPGPGGV